MAGKKGNKNANILRAGKRKCKRCKLVWNRGRGDACTICLYCRVHCKRCDINLTEENRGSAKNTYQCSSCQNELQNLNHRNNKLRARDYRLNKKYGITILEYETILKAQGGVCWICGSLPGKRQLSVDHEHVYNDKNQNPRDTRQRVRGLLCWPCNSAIAKFKDDVVRLRNAADYLEQWPAQEILKEK